MVNPIDHNCQNLNILHIYLSFFRLEAWGKHLLQIEASAHRRTFWDVSIRRIPQYGFRIVRNSPNNSIKNILISNWFSPLQHGWLRSVLRNWETSTRRFHLLGVCGEPLHASNSRSSSLLPRPEHNPPRPQATLYITIEQRELGSHQSRWLRYRHRTRLERDAHEKRAHRLASVHVARSRQAARLLEADRHLVMWCYSIYTSVRISAVHRQQRAHFRYDFAWKISC